MKQPVDFRPAGSPSIANIEDAYEYFRSIFKPDENILWEKYDLNFYLDVEVCKSFETLTFNDFETARVACLHDEQEIDRLADEQERRNG